MRHVGSNDPIVENPWFGMTKIRTGNKQSDQTKHNRDKVVFNKDLFNWYKKFIYLRNQYQASQKPETIQRY